MPDLMEEEERGWHSRSDKDSSITEVCLVVMALGVLDDNTLESHEGTELIYNGGVAEE